MADPCRDAPLLPARRYAPCGPADLPCHRARVYDALGLVGLPLQLPTACSIAVEPEPLEPAELPNLSQFQYRSYHPKPGGGFSEIHDLREYRPGDSLHEIHWKLSAKTDKLIVREAEEPDRGLIVLSFDFPAAGRSSTVRCGSCCGCPAG